jgi:hypothetical protein
LKKLFSVKDEAFTTPADAGAGAGSNTDADADAGAADAADDKDEMEWNMLFRGVSICVCDLVVH